MKKLFRKILLKMIGGTDCGTPYIQMERENKISKMMKGATSDLSEKDKDLLIKYYER